MKLCTSFYVETAHAKWLFIQDDGYNCALKKIWKSTQK